MQNLPTLAARLSDFHLLKHPYYQAWTDGTLTLGSLQEYACQYFHHVEAFPRYLSSIHSMCENTRGRQHLLENLIEEERGESNHPRLWLDFAKGLGASEERARSTELFDETHALISTFMGLARSSYAEGLGALYAYEHQIPEIAQFKMDGLKKNFGISDESTLRFFDVHRQADVIHSQVVLDLLNALSPEDRKKADAAAEVCAKALWKFLDGVDSRTRLKAA